MVNNPMEVLTQHSIIHLMEPRPNSSFLPYLASAISLFVLGLGAAAIAIFALTPTVWARWLLFFGGTLGLTGLALPVTWFLNLRFPSEPPAGSHVIVRQAIWVGVYGVVLAWLQQVRLVTIWTGLGLAVGAGRHRIPDPHARESPLAAKTHAR